MTAAIHLPIAITADEDIASMDDFFSCVPLSARMRVEHCIRLQAEHGEVVALNHCGSVDRKASPSRMAKRRINNGRCGDCEQGRKIMGRVTR